MANLNGVSTRKGAVGPNTNTQGERRVSMLVYYETNGNAAISEGVYELFKPQDLLVQVPEALVAEYPILNRHLSEFYRMASNGTPLFVLISKIGLDEGLIDVIKTALVASDGRVRQMGYVSNSGEFANVDGWNSFDFDNLTSFIAPLPDWAYENHMPLQVLYDGHCVSPISAVVPNMRALPNDQNLPKISVVIGQDWEFWETMPADLRQHADVGTALGVLAKCAINQNIGDNEAFNLTDVNRGIWVVPGLSAGHVKNVDVHEDLQTFEDKGYIFGLKYTGLAGVRFNNDHVCAPIVIDAEGNMNEHSISIGRTVDDAVRKLRSVYLPKVKKTYPLDEATGKLPIGVVAALQKIGQQVFDDMKLDGEISGGRVSVDPNSDLLIAKELIVYYSLVPTGTIGEIKGTINVKNKL